MNKGRRSLGVEGAWMSNTPSRPVWESVQANIVPQNLAVKPTWDFKRIRARSALAKPPTRQSFPRSATRTCRARESKWDVPPALVRLQRDSHLVVIKSNPDGSLGRSPGPENLSFALPSLRHSTCGMLGKSVIRLIALHGGSPKSGRCRLHAETIRRST
jgi:hypothetical protein